MLTAEHRKGRKPANYGRRFPPEVYTREEIAGLMRHCGRGPGGYRNRALIAVLWRSALRISEALALELHHLDFEVGAITIMHGKGDYRRMAPLDPTTAALLELWIKGPRSVLRLPRSAPVFCTYERGNVGRPLRGAYVRDALKRAGRRAGIEKRIHPHGLRHTWAYENLREGRDVVAIQTVLGHRDLGTTQRYLSHRFPVKILEDVNSRPWPDELADLVRASNGRHGANGRQTN